MAPRDNGSPDPPDQAPDEWLAAGFGPAPSSFEERSTFWEALETEAGPLPEMTLRPLDDAHAPDAQLTSDEMSGSDSRDSSGRYEMVGEIARGGIGVVMKAMDRDLGREVAVKALRRKHAADPNIVQRFVEEAQIGGQLIHPGIVPIYELGMLADGRPFFSMKLVEGKTLRELLTEREDPKQDRERFIKLFEQICHTVAFAHARGVIHRDLKPANIMVGAFAEILVMDWGLSKVMKRGGLADEVRPGLRRSTTTVIETVRTENSAFESEVGSVMGTFAYMSPEQARGEQAEIAASSDVFSLGAILCQILTGAPPYLGENSQAVFYQASRGLVEPALEHLSKCGAEEELLDLARHCLSPVASNRPREAGSVAQTATRFLERREERLRQAEDDAEAAQARKLEARKRMAQEQRTRRLTAVLSAVIVVAAIASAWVFNVVAADGREREGKALDRLENGLSLAGQIVGELRERPGIAEAEFDRALDTLQRARTLAKDDALEEKVEIAAEARIHRLEVRVIRRQMEAATQTRDRAMAARLQEIRLHAGEDWDWERQARYYPQVFTEYGIDIGAANLEKNAEAVRTSSISDTLVEALDQWVIAIHLGKERDLPLGKKLNELLDSADDNSWRQDFRRAWRSRNLSRVKQLVERSSPEVLGSSTSAFVGFALGTLGRDAEAAVSWLSRARAVDPDDFWVNQFLGRFHLEASPPDHKAAIRCLTAALAKRPTSVGALDILGIALHLDGRADEAIEAFQKALSAHPDDAIAHAHLAGVYLDGKGDSDEALELLERSLELRPDYATAILFQGNAHAARRDIEKAQRAFERVLKLKPLDDSRTRLSLANIYAKALLNLGKCHLSRGDSDTALKHWQQAATLAPDRAIIHFNIGRLFETKGNWQKALESHKQAIRCDKTHSQALTNIAFILNLQGDEEEAIRRYRRAIKAGPANPTPRINLGNLLRLRGELSEALKLTKAAVRITEASRHWSLGNRRRTALNARTNLAIVYSDLGEHALAEREFREVTKQDSNYVNCWLNLGLAQVRAGHWREAIKSWTRCLEQRPGLRSAHQNIAETLLNHGSKKEPELSEALKQFHLANAIKPLPGTWNGIGRVFEERGEYQKASASYAKALALDPEHAPSIFNQGLIKQQIHDHVGAIESFDGAIRLRRREARWIEQRGVSRYLSGEFDAAIADFEDALLLNPTLRKAHLHLGLSWLRKGHGQRALEIWRASRRSVPDDFVIQASLGKVLLDLGRARDATVELGKAIELARESTSRQREATAALEDARSWLAIQKDLDRALKMRPGLKDPRAEVLVARVCRAAGRAAEGVEIWRKVLPRMAQAENWFEAARCAAGAAGERKQPSAARTRFRQLALQWLREDLQLCMKEFPQKKRKDVYALLRTLRQRQVHRDLAPIRDEEALEKEKVSTREREPFRRFWNDFSATISRVEAHLAATRPGEAQ